jgi:Rieske Fe-S protein
MTDVSCIQQHRSIAPIVSQDIDRKRFLALAATALAGAALDPLWRPAQAAAATMRLAAPQRAWDKAEFTYPGTDGSFPGIAVRLPQAAGGGLCAVCSICPHMGCIFGYETDYEDVGNMIGLRLSHPVFHCACHGSTYDPLRIDNVIHGPTPRRPWLFAVHEDATDMIVTGIEAGAGEIK